jgi:hypothetical protein
MAKILKFVSQKFTLPVWGVIALAAVIAVWSATYQLYFLWSFHIQWNGQRQVFADMSYRLFSGYFAGFLTLYALRSAQVSIFSLFIIAASAACIGTGLFQGFAVLWFDRLAVGLMTLVYMVGFSRNGASLLPSAIGSAVFIPLFSLALISAAMTIWLRAVSGRVIYSRETWSEGLATTVTVVATVALSFAIAIYLPHSPENQRELHTSIVWPPRIFAASLLAVAATMHYKLMRRALRNQPSDPIIPRAGLILLSALVLIYLFPYSTPASRMVWTITEAATTSVNYLRPPQLRVGNYKLKQAFREKTFSLVEPKEDGSYGSISLRLPHFTSTEGLKDVVLPSWLCLVLMLVHRRSGWNARGMQWQTTRIRDCKP